MNIFETVRERLGVDLRDFTGAFAAGEIPVPDGLVNRMLARRLEGHAHLTAVTLRADANDNIGIEVVLRLRLVPVLRIAAHIERQPELPADPTLVLRWSMPAMGPLSMLAGPALSLFKKLPPGIRAEGDLIVVDLRELARAGGFAESLALVKRLAVHTRPGAFVVAFDVGL